MPKIVPPGRCQRAPVFLLASILFLPAGPTPTPVPLPKMKVKVVEVIKDGATIRVDPSRVKLKRRSEIVVWVTNGQSLKVQFKAGNPTPGNPFTDLTCKGRFCGVLTPPDVAPNVFRYSVNVDGVVLDPDVEVVP